MTTQEESQKAGADLMENLIKAAWENPEFKKQLIENPAKTIGSFIGKDLNGKMPNGKEIVVIDQSDENKFFLNIPAEVNLDHMLSEDQLDLVAGGAGGPVYEAGVWAGHQVKEFWNWATS